MRTSTYTSTTFSPPELPHPPSHPAKQPLKIKLTVPPNLKFRKNSTLNSSSTTVRGSASQSYPGRSTAHASGSTSVTMPQEVALGLLDPSVPKRRGRPPKAVVAAREAAKAALASAHASYLPRSIARKGTHVTVSSMKRSQGYTANKRGAFTRPTKKAIGKRPLASGHSPSYSSDDDNHYPTFMSAASTSSLTSSSESQSLDSSESSSESEEDDLQFSQKHPKKDMSGFDQPQKRRDHGSGNRWEIKPRKQSVDPECGMDADSEDTSEDEDNADDEDESDEEDDDEDDDENAAEADVEETGLADGDEDIEVGETDGKLGVSYGGDGWSDDEESSFDADLFFANLDDDSDSPSSPAALRLDTFDSDMDEDLSDAFSRDEEDALLLMDMDPSVQVRRSSGEFEVGVELDALALGLDGQLLLPSDLARFAAFEGGFDSHDSDINMTISQGGSSTVDEGGDSDASSLFLDESDGETTEDELVDSNGLPNSKAMMLFRWPEPISAVDPQSTVSSSHHAEDPHEPQQPSHTLRQALRSMRNTAAVCSGSSHSADEFDDGRLVGEGSKAYGTEAGHSTGAPVMGQFVPPTAGSPRIAIIDGKCSSIPSPFPRSRNIRSQRRKRRVEGNASGFSFTTDSEVSGRNSSALFVAVQPPSSDELGSQSHALTSDDPSSTEAIDLDDVLDASFLDSDPLFEPTSPQHGWLSPSTPTSAVPTENLTRWDRIPVGTFRRTRETSMLESTPGSDTGIANLYPAISALLNSDMLGTPRSKGAKLKGKARKAPKSGTSSTLVISPVLLPVRDGDRTPTNGTVYNPFHPSEHSHQQKSRKELRKEKAIMKRKMVGKYAPQPSMRNNPHAHRHHYPNMKSRGSSSVQRTQFASSSHVPHLNI